MRATVATRSLSSATDPESHPESAPGLRRAVSPRRCVVEHQGMRFVHQPDGTIVCETMPAPGAREDDSCLSPAHNVPVLGTSVDKLGDVARHVATTLGILGGCLGGMVGLLGALSSDFEGKAADYGRVAWLAQGVVRSVVVGAVSGGVIAPVAAVAGLLRLAVRPALLAVAVHSTSRWLTRHHIGAAAILKRLQSGDLSRQLEALRQLVARLSNSAAFCSQFKKLAGVEVLLKLLADFLAAAEQGTAALSGPQGALIARALAELAKQGDAVNTMVDLGAVPLLLSAVAGGLGQSALVEAGAPSSPCAAAARASADSRTGSGALLVYSATALARVASKNAVAQQMLASEATAAPVVVTLLEQANARRVRGVTVDACDELRTHAVALAQAIALEPAGKVSLGRAGAVDALSAALMLTSPWTQGQAAAAAALHALVRGDMENQRRLAAVAPAGLSAAINRALTSGPATSTATASPVGSPKAGAQGPLSDSVLSGGIASAARPLASQDRHAHKADLLALTNVINKFAPAAASNIAVAAVATVAARPMPLLSRLRLRPAPAVKPAAVAPVPAPEQTSGGGASAVTGESSGVVTGVVSEEEGLGSEDWDCSVEAGALAAADATSSVPASATTV